MAETAVTAAPPPAQRKKKYAFQVLAGRHWEPGEVVDDTGRTSIKDVRYGPGCPAGDIVETDVELDRRFNRPNSIKFKRVGADGQRDARLEEVNAERHKANSAQAALKAALEKMPRDALVAWAEEQEINLGNAVKRDEVLRAILAALG